MNNAKLTTKLGKIRGIDFGEYSEFRGIRYATAGRWEYPQICGAWEGEYDAT